MKYDLRVSLMSLIRRASCRREDNEGDATHSEQDVGDKEMRYGETIQ